MFKLISTIFHLFHSIIFALLKVSLGTWLLIRSSLLLAVGSNCSFSASSSVESIHFRIKPFASQPTKGRLLSTTTELHRNNVQTSNNVSYWRIERSHCKKQKYNWLRKMEFQKEQPKWKIQANLWRRTKETISARKGMEAAQSFITDFVFQQAYTFHPGIVT